MANLTITPANVVPPTSANFVLGTSGEALAMCDAIYLNAATGKWVKAPSTVAETAQVGLLMSGAVAADQQIVILTQPNVNVGFGAILTQKTVYCISATDGAIAPLADLTGSETLFILGVGISTTEMRMLFKYTGA